MTGHAPGPSGRTAPDGPSYSSPDAPPPSRAGPLERPASSVSAQRVLLLATLALLPALLLALFWVGQAAFFLLFAGILFAAILDAAVRGLEAHAHLERSHAVTTVIALVVAAIAALAWFGGSYVLSQSGELYRALENQAGRVADFIQRVGIGTDEAMPDSPFGVLRELGRMWWGDGGGPATFAQSVLGVLANAFIVFFIGVFLVIEPGLYARGLVRLFPTEHRETVDGALHRAGDTLRRWLVGKLASMAMVLVLTLVGLLVIGYPFALPLALLAGSLAFVPNLGPLLTYVPIALVGFSAGTTTLLLGLGVYAVAQTVESYVFTPVVQKHMVSLPPALILFAQVLGGIVFGLWGVALATPLAAVLRGWVGEYYVRRELEDAPPRT